MGKFLLGVVSGGLLVMGGLAATSVLFPVQPANTNDKVAAVEEPISAPEPTKVEAGPTPEETAAPEEPVVAEEPTPPAQAGTEPADPVGLTKPATKAAPAAEATAEVAPVVSAPPPDLGSAAASPDAPPADSAAVELIPEVPDLAEIVAPKPPAQPPKPPVSEADMAAAEPEAAPAVQAVVVEAAPEVAEDPARAAEEATAVVDPAPEAAETTEPAEAIASEAAPEVAVAPEGGEVTAEMAPEVAPEVAPEPLPEPEVAPEAEAPPPMLAEAEADALPGDEARTMPGVKPDALPGTQAEVAEAEPEPESGPTFKRAPGLTEGEQGVVTGRLPNLGDATAEAVAEETAPPADPRPIAVHAARFENPDNKPGFAVVLIDQGGADLDRAALAALPFPVSFALDPLDPATPDRAALYRAAGKEVVMIASGIAEGAQPSDVEVAFQSMALGLPEAVAVMDLATPQFQNNRLLASAVVPIVKAQGRGLLTWDAGLNAADQVARRDDLEAAVVFRDLGSAEGDRVAVRRLLDRAVFKAGQDGRVTVVGAANAETVAALLEWTVEGKAATVALAPLTAVLKID